jgi:hypothetical protein
VFGNGIICPLDRLQVWACFIVIEVGASLQLFLWATMNQNEGDGQFVGAWPSSDGLQVKIYRIVAANVRGEV